MWVNIFEDECIFFSKTFSELSQSYDDIFSSNLENIFKDDCIFFKNFLEIMMTSSKMNVSFFSKTFSELSQHHDFFLGVHK